MSNPFIELQTAAAARLDHDSLSAIPRLTEDPQDPLNEAFKALYQGSLPANGEGRSGVCLVLGTPAGSTPVGGTDLVVGDLALQISIFELVPLNRDAAAGIGVAALQVLWACIQRLQGWQHKGMAPLEFRSYASEEDPQRPGLVAYFAEFVVSGGWSAEAEEQAAAPAFDPLASAGPFTAAQSVTITSATAGATIRYTTDGSQPTRTHGTVYAAPVAIAATTLLRAVAYKNGLSLSDETPGVFELDIPLGVVATPQFSPASGEVEEETEVTLTCATAGASIYYTLDGSEPDATDTLYSGPITVSETTLIRAIAVKSGLTESKQNAAHYVFASGGGPANATASIGTAAGNNGLIFTAVAAGTAGNGIGLEFDFLDDPPARISVYDGIITMFCVRGEGSSGASAIIGSGDAGIAFGWAVDGARGNLVTITVENGVGLDLEPTFSFDDFGFVITLGTDGSGNPDPAKNTALLIAQGAESYLLGEGSQLGVIGLVGDGSGIVTPTIVTMTGGVLLAATTATALKAAIEANAEASALVTVAHMPGSDGSGAVDVAMRTVGGVD